GRKEMAAALPVPFLFTAHEPQVRLMNQRRGLKRLSGLLLCELSSSQQAQLLIHERQQSFRGAWVAGLYCGKNVTYVRHNAVRTFGFEAGRTGTQDPACPTFDGGYRLPFPADYRTYAEEHKECALPFPPGRSTPGIL